MSLNIAKLLKNPVVLASAALVIHIGAATAANSPSDVQQQMKELLAGTTTAHFSAPTAAGVGKVTSPTTDAQEFAKGLLLGTNGSRNEVAVMAQHAAAAPLAHPVAYADMQTAVRRILLGHNRPADAS